MPAQTRRLPAYRPTHPSLNLRRPARPRTAAHPSAPAGGRRSGSGGLAGLAPGLNPINNSAVNAARAIGVFSAIKLRFPSVTSGGICNCRHQRGTGSDPNRWSVHSVCGAVDVWPTAAAPASAIIAFAKTLPGVWDAWLDDSPGDVHVQVIPNPPAGWVPPCAGGAPLPTPAPVVTDPLWDLLTKAGFSDTIRVPGEPNGLTAREMAWCIAKAESGGNLNPGGNLFQFTVAPPRDPLANARRALATSAGGTVWVAWCTAFGGPRVNPRPGVPGGSKANCGHRGPNYLRTVGGIAPAYTSHIGELPPGGIVNRGTNRETSANATPGLVATGLFANCSDRTAALGGFVTSGIQGTPSATIDVGHVLTHDLGKALCNVPVLGTVSCGLASFFAHFPQYLKVAAGGAVLLIGTAFVIVSVTGGTKSLRLIGEPAAQAAAKVAPAAAARRQAIVTERATQRRRAAQDEAESRVGITSRGRVRTQRRREYRGAVRTAERAGREDAEASGGENRAPAPVTRIGLGSKRRKAS